MSDALFAALYLDEVVDVLLGQLLAARGFSALTVTEVNRRGMSDEEQLRFAAAAGRALVTHNRVDFERLAVQWMEAERPHSGIVIAVRRPVYEIRDRLVQLLNTMTAGELANQIWYV